MKCANAEPLLHTGLGSCDCLVTTFLSNNLIIHILILYICLKMLFNIYYLYVIGLLTLSS